MSNFNCEICGKAITEGKGGHYVTFCKHYPKEKYDKKDNLVKTKQVSVRGRDK